jgi:hypothetical protein
MWWLFNGLCICVLSDAFLSLAVFVRLRIYGIRVLLVLGFGFTRNTTTLASTLLARTLSPTIAMCCYLQAVLLLTCFVALSVGALGWEFYEWFHSVLFMPLLGLVRRATIA